MVKQLQKIFPYFLFCYHLLFAYISYRYVAANGGDAVRYWFSGEDLADKKWTDFLHVGTDVVKLITFPMVKYLKFSPLMGFFCFSLWSYLGIYKLWKLLQTIVADHKTGLVAVMVLMALPNLHFWTSVIGKEAVLFVPMVVLASQFYKGKYGSGVSLLAFAGVMAVRPHVAAILLFGVLIALLLHPKMGLKSRLLLCSIALGISGLIYILLLKITRVEGNLWWRIKRLYAAHFHQLQATDAYVPLEQYSLPYKIFTFYFRPFPWDGHTVYFRILGIEGMVLLSIVLLSMFFFVRTYKQHFTTTFQHFCLIFVLAYALVFVYAYANFGLLVRTRTLAFPFLYALVASIFSAFEKKHSHTKTILPA